MNSSSIEDSQIIPTEREQEFIDLYTQRIKAPKIASIMGINVNTVRVYACRLRKKGFLPHVGHLELKTDTHRSYTKAEVNVQNFIQAHEDLFNVSPRIKYVDIEQVKEVIKLLNYRKQDVNMLIRLYVERDLFEEASNILYDYEANNELSEEEKAQIVKLKHKLRLEMLTKLNGSLPNYMIDSQEPFLDNDR